MSEETELTNDLGTKNKPLPGSGEHRDMDGGLLLQRVKDLPRFFVFDVESIGLYGEAFAVGGGTYFPNGTAENEFEFSCYVQDAAGTLDNHEWVSRNCPPMNATEVNRERLAASFWREWEMARGKGAIMAADCPWPVEARFLLDCIAFSPARMGQGPYPIIDVSSVVLAAGINPIQEFERYANELPKHNPLKDARQSARILFQCLAELRRGEAI